MERESGITLGSPVIYHPHIEPHNLFYSGIAVDERVESGIAYFKIASTDRRLQGKQTHKWWMTGKNRGISNVPIELLTGEISFEDYLRKIVSEETIECEDISELSKKALMQDSYCLNGLHPVMFVDQENLITSNFYHPLEEIADTIKSRSSD